LGLVAGYRYIETEFFLAPGDILIAMTDGVTDALASASDLLGLEAATRLLEAMPAAPNRICASLLTAAGAGGFRDDATILVAEHRPFEVRDSARLTAVLCPREASHAAA
jgi:serine phosphatase RsbU (regulator of sigma subunit)